MTRIGIFELELVDFSSAQEFIFGFHLLPQLVANIGLFPHQGEMSALSLYHC